MAKNPAGLSKKLCEFKSVSPYKSYFSTVLGISMKIESSSRSHAIIEKKVGSISQAYTEALLETSGNAFQVLF